MILLKPKRGIITWPITKTTDSSRIKGVGISHFKDPDRHLIKLFFFFWMVNQTYFKLKSFKFNFHESVFTSNFFNVSMWLILSLRHLNWLLWLFNKHGLWVCGRSHNSTTPSHLAISKNCDGPMSTLARGEKKKLYNTVVVGRRPNVRKSICLKLGSMVFHNILWWPWKCL